MSITRGEFLRSLGKSLPGMVASTGVATAAEALLRRIAQASPSASEAPIQPVESVPFYEHGPEEGHEIALTFDDGPVPGITEIILDELKKRSFHATFFMIGHKVVAAPDLARRVLAEGHEIGNHTHNHSKLTELSDTAAEAQVEQAENTFRDLLDYKPTWFRPPFGALRQNQATFVTKRNLGVALWSVDPEDWRVPYPSRIEETIFAKTKAGSILLCHEMSGTAAIVSNIFDGLKMRQFRPVTISSLLKNHLS